MSGLEEEFTSQITFERLLATTAENEELQQQFAVRGHPSVVIIDANGEVAAKFIGEQSAETLRAAIQDMLP